MIKFGKYLFEKKNVFMTCSVMMVFCLVCNSRPAAQDIKISPTKTPVATKSPAQAMNLKESLENALLAEQDNYQQLEVQLQQMLFFGKDIEAEINAYKIEISAYNSLLLVSTTSTEELEKVHGNSTYACCPNSKSNKAFPKN